MVDVLKVFEQSGTLGDGFVTAPATKQDTLVGTTSTQTLTNKTMTSPTLNTPTISAPTITGASSIVRTAQSYMQGGFSKVGGTAGWVVAAADNTNLITMPASLTGSKLIIPVIGLKVGWTITGFHLVGQIESAGGIATLDADLRKHTAAAADPTDASLGTITQLSVTADTKVDSANTTKTLATPEVIAQDESFYMVLTATTAAATDIALMGGVVIVTET
jgi:hypothetical protein